jgi:rRNA-processing protein FCF1
MKLVVNDTNILIDLVELGLLEEFSKLEFELHTIDLIINELEKPGQKASIDAFVGRGLLVVASLKSEEYMFIAQKMASTVGLSFEDCAVWYYAETHKGILLTGDAKLRSSAQKAKLEVKGILFVFDQLVESEIVTKSFAASKLEELLCLNPRLPISEVRKRINQWKGE